MEKSIKVLCVVILLLGIVLASSVNAQATNASTNTLNTITNTLDNKITNTVTTNTVISNTVTTDDETETTAMPTKVEIPVIDKMKATRKDDGNTITVKLNEEFFCDVSKLDTDVQNELSTSSLYVYLPLIEGYTKYPTIKYYQTEKGNTYNSNYENTANLVDSKFNYVSQGSKSAKYIKVWANATQNEYDANAKVKATRIIGCNTTFNIKYYDEQGKVAKTAEYTITIEPKFNLRDIRIADAKNLGNYYYDGRWTGDYGIGMEKGENLEFQILRSSTKDDITKQVKLTSKTPEVFTVENGKIIAKKVGEGKLKIESNGLSSEINVTIYPQSYFKDEVTEEQIDDLIEYAKTTNSEQINLSVTSKSAVVPSKLFKAAKDLGKSVYVWSDNGEEGDKYFGCGWLFKAEDITNTDIDVNFGVTRVEPFTDALKDKENVAYIDFKHEGVLPGKATISIYNMFKENWKYDANGTDKEAYLYHYNEKAKKFDEKIVGKRDKSYNFTFEIEHCSLYAGVYDEIDASLVDLNRKLDGSPKTGDNSVAGMLLLTIAFSACTIVALKKEN